ncbi:hypothetical protein BVRB_3g067040 [Beta vulgaris subsp. vulgaris]|nr:hypothetical protein BVRB_3g067040 [Beta vulgaris subsp. vulgaris]
MDSESSKFHTVQPLRDLESNWAVDLAKNLEDYLLKICSGEISGGDDSHLSVNFAEAALLLQGSIQVYSRKVEYLYNLVLHALEFISQTRSQDPVETTSVQPEASSSRAVHDEDDQFWVSDDISVDAKNCLDGVTSKDTFLDHFIKPPANLVVLEGDCLDSTDDGGELESYLLATNNLYCDFILLDPCDSVAVDEFLKGDKSGDRQHGSNRGSSLISKAHKSFLSPARRSGGTARKSSVKKRLDDLGQASPLGGTSKNLNDDFEPGPSCNDNPVHGNYGFESDNENPQHEDIDDSDGDGVDPWKTLNPHEPGNLKVKPFRKVKIPKRIGMMKNINVASQFPLAKLHGTISPELTRIWELHICARKRQETQPIPLYEKLRETLVGGHPDHDTFCPPENGAAEDASDDGIHDFDEPDFDMPDINFMDEQVNFEPFKHDDFADHYDAANANLKEDASTEPSLEDLCRAHLDALLANIAESENQSELAARVSSWKQRTEHDLEEEDSRPPFDIHEYGEVVLERLSLGEDESLMSFTDVVKGREKHDIARTFSALLQLVNDRKVDLERSTSTSDSFCYTAVNPFHIRLLSHAKGPKKMQFQFTKKRQKSPITRGCKKGEIDNLSRQPLVVGSPSSASKSRAILAQPNCKFSAKLEKDGRLGSTPDRKRRRRSRLVEAVDLSSA